MAEKCGETHGMAEKCGGKGAVNTVAVKPSNYENISKWCMKNKSMISPEKQDIILLLISEHKWKSISKSKNTMILDKSTVTMTIKLMKSDAKLMISPPPINVKNTPAKFSMTKKGMEFILDKDSYRFVKTTLKN